MNQIADGGRDPYCGGGNACQLSADGTQDKYDGVQFFDFASATISGLGDLAGLVYELTVKPNGLAKPPQFGYCGNWYDCTLGYSNWFFAKRISDATVNQDNDDSNDILTFGGLDAYGRDRIMHGDLNINAVPLPAAGWMLLAGVGAIAATRRKKS